MGKPRASNDPSVRTQLTDRQREVLALIVAGRTNGEIADELGLTLDGAKWHVREIFARLDVSSREEAAAWWRRNRPGRIRLLAGLGWPVAVAAGGVTATVVVVALALLFMAANQSAGGTNADVGTGASPLAQPALALASEGEGWQMFVDEDGGLPHARDAVLAIHVEGETSRVELMETATGRVAARWNVGYNPAAVLRESTNELLISDLSDWDEEHPWRLLRFSLERNDLVESRPLPGRAHTRTQASSMMALSSDDATLFYVAPLYPDCFEEVGQMTRIARDCDRHRVGILDMDSPGLTPRLVDVGESCRVRLVGFDDPAHGPTVFLPCAGSEVYTVSASGVVALRPEQFPERRDAVAPLGNVLEPMGVVLGTDWAGALHGDGMFTRSLRDGTVERRSLLRGSDAPRDFMPVSESRAVITFREGFAMLDTANSELVAKHETGEFRSLLPLNEDVAILLRMDGTLEKVNLETGESEGLPHRLPITGPPAWTVHLTR